MPLYIPFYINHFAVQIYGIGSIFYTDMVKCHRNTAINEKDNSVFDLDRPDIQRHLNIKEAYNILYIKQKLPRIQNR